MTFDDWFLILFGLGLILAIIIGLYFRKKARNDQKVKNKIEKFNQGIATWGLISVGIILALIETTVYFLDIIKFSIIQLIIGIGMIIVGFYYLKKYKNL